MLRFSLRSLAAVLILCTAAALPARAAGTLPIALQQVMDANGKPISGALLYIFQVGTVATPQNAFQDSGLTHALPFPLQADANGRLPMFYLADGSVHVRLTDASGVVQFDYPSMMVVGSSGGGGGGGTVDPTSVISTGDIKVKYGTGPLAGFVRANGLTIGGVTSGATERANADTQSLFVYLWMSDASLTVSGGRGASGLADFNASKTIALPDYRGTFIAGLDDMGAAASSRLAGFTTLGVRGGNISYTIAKANLPVYNLNYSGLAVSKPTVGITDPTHGHGYTDPQHTHAGAVTGGSGVTGAGSISSGLNIGTVGLGVTINPSTVGITIAHSATGITAAVTSNPLLSGTLPSGGSGNAMTIVPPIMPATIYLKL